MKIKFTEPAFLFVVAIPCALAGSIIVIACSLTR